MAYVSIRIHILKARCNIHLLLLLKLMYFCALLGYPHKEERNDDCRRIKVTRCAMTNQYIFKLDAPERLVRLDWWISYIS